jgi:phage terminase large subunit-like protein
MRFRTHDGYHLPLDKLLDYYELYPAANAHDAEAFRAARRHLAQTDLFYLLTQVFGRLDMVHPWVYARCREVQANPDGYLDLWAREHYKSTVITHGLTILDIINNPNITIGIFSHNKTLAGDFLQAIKTTLESNATLKWLFPDVLHDNPRNQPQQWGLTEGLFVKRAVVRKEPTVSAWGLVDGMPTGMHFDVRVYDDVVTEKSVTNPRQIRKTTDQWALSTNLGTEGGVARYAGTYYHLHDTYHEMQNRGVKSRIYPCTADGTDDFTQAVLKSPEYLANKRKEQGVYMFSCQMLLNPLADSIQGFKEDWWQTWEGGHDSNMNKVIIVDPSSGKRGRDGKADNDYTSIWVFGLGGDGNWYMLDGIRDRINLTARADALLALHRKWKPMKVGYEDYGMQADIEHIEYRQAEENYRFVITPLGGQMSKPIRIKRLVPLFEGKRIYMLPSLIRGDWDGRAVDIVKSLQEEEYNCYPVVKHDDMLDCMSRLCDEEIASIPLPTPKPKGYDALAAYKRQQRRNRVLV